MKKKLIAIVASLAMVATMVPATAFAGVAGTNATIGAADARATRITISDLSGITIGKASITQMGMDGIVSGDDNKYVTATSGWAFNEAVSGTFNDRTLTLTGVVPFTTKLFNPGAEAGEESDRNKEGWYDPAERAGHYVGLRVRAAKPDNEDVTGWALAYSSEEKETLDDKTIKSGTIDKLYTYKYGDGGKETETILKKLPESGNMTFTVYYLTDEGVQTFARYSHTEYNKEVASIAANGFQALFGDADLTGTGKNATVEADTDAGKVNARLTDVIAEANRANGIAGTKVMTVDLSALKKLTQEQSDALKGFKEAVTAIKAEITEADEVTTAYRQKTIAAQATYDALDATSKEAVTGAAKDTSLNTAYKGLETAQANIKSFDQISAVAELIKALPAPSALDLKDEKAVEQVKDAQAAVKKLSEGARTALLATTDNPYLTATQVANYNGDVAKIQDSDINTVVDAINALPKLPKEFTDKASVDTVYAPLEAVNKAYDSLSDDDQKTVDNRTLDALKDYQKDYTKLIKDYVDPLYEKAAAINLEQPLTADDVALITELKAYVEGDYIKTRDIDGFRQTKYDALIAALGNEYDLSEATVTVKDVDALVYDGTKKTPAVTVTDKAGKEIAADNYTVIYSDNKDAGEATVTVAAKGATYTGSATATFTIKPAALTADMVKVANATYTGKALKPAVSVASGVDYTVAYKNNTAVGKASAVVTGTGNYTGTITKNFIVKPAKESITSLKAGKKQITVAYKAQTGAKYRVICKASGLKAIGTNTTATKKTVKKLKSGKTYQVKVRAYKAVDGKTYYGTYSAVKKVKVK